MSKSIELKFGVLGGGSISSGSGKIIADQINSIVNQIESGGITNLKFRVDPASLKVIQTQLGSIGSAASAKDLTAGLSKLEAKYKSLGESFADPGATSSLERMKDSIAEINRLRSLSNPSERELASLKQLEQQWKNNTKEVQDYINAVNQQKAAITRIAGTGANSVESHYNEAQQFYQYGSLGSDTASATALNAKMQELNSKFSAYNALKSQADVGFIGPDDITLLETYGNEVRTLSNEIRNLSMSASGDRRAGLTFGEMENFSSIQRQAKAVANLKRLYGDQINKNAELSSSFSQLEKSFTLNSAGNAYIGFQNTAKGAKMASTAVNNFRTKLDEAGIVSQSFIYKTKELFTKHFSTYIAMAGVTLAMQAFRQLYENVSNVDKAMTELKKVTDETNETYNRFLDSAIKKSKELGTSVSDYVNATADFARLGYSIDESNSLATAATVYKNVGDGIDSIDTASESIIATMKAFGMEATEAMDIIDAFNEVGNNFAISSTGIGEAITRSASSLHVAGNTLAESIALITAANSSVQNPEKVGTTLKTVTMFLRAAKDEAEEAGESTEGMANSVSELRDSILHLTDQKVDIMIDDSTFKSTTQILRELSQVWDSLTDVDQANILEQIGGKRNSNVVSSLITNFETVEEVLKTIQNDAGSAMTEQEKWLDSIEGKTNQFKTSFEALSTSILSSELTKNILEFGTNVLNSFNKVTEFINAAGGLKTVLLGIASVLAITNAAWITNIAVTKSALIANKLVSAFRAIGSVITSMPSMISNMVMAWASYSASTTMAGASTASLSAAMQASIPVIGLVLAAITAIIGVISSYNSIAEKQADKTRQVAKSTKEASEGMTSLLNSYISLDEEVKTNVGATDELAEKQEELRRELGLTSSELDNLIEKYGSATAALENFSRQKLNESERDLRAGFSQASKDLLKAGRETLKKSFNPGDLLRDIYPEELRKQTVDADYHILERDGGTIESAIELYTRPKEETRRLYENTAKGIKALAEAGYDVEAAMAGLYQQVKGGPDLASVFVYDLPSEYDLETIEGLIAAYEELGSMLDIVGSEVGSDNLVYSGLYKAYSVLSTYISEYEELGGSLNEVLATQYKIQAIINNKIPETKTEFDDFRASLIESAVASGEFVGTQEDIEKVIDDVLRNDTRFTSFYNNIAEDANGASDAVTGLSKSISALKKMSGLANTMNSVIGSMNEGNGLQFDDLSSIADQMTELGMSADEIDKYTQQALDAQDSATDMQRVFSDLTNDIITQKIATGELTSKHENLLASFLKQCGVVNATEVAHERLGGTITITKEEYELLSDELKNQVKAVETANGAYEIEAEVIEELGGTVDTMSQIIALAQAGITDVTISNCQARVEALKKEAEAYLKIQALINGLNTAMPGLGNMYGTMGTLANTLFDKLGMGDYDVSGTGGMTYEEYQKSQKAADQIKIYEDALKELSEITFDGGGSGSGDPVLDAWNKSVEEQKHLLEMDKITREEYYEWLRNSYKSALDDVDKYSDERKKIEEELYNWEKDRIRDTINEDKAQLDYDKAKGTISEEEYFEKLEKIYSDGYEELQIAVDEFGLYGVDTQERLEAETQFIEDIKSAHTSAYEAEKKQLEHNLSMKLITEEQYLIELSRLYAKYYAGQEEYSEEAMEAQEELFNKQTEIIEKWAQAAADAVESIASAAEDAVSAVTNLIEGSIDAHEENFNLEKGLLDHSLAMNYISEEEYYNSLESLYKKYFKDKYVYMEQYWENQEAVYQHEQEMLEESASAVEDIHAKVVDMIKQELEDTIESIEKAKDKYLDLIDVRRKALDDKKSEEDYTKERDEQVSNIAELQRQLNDLENDTSAAGIRKYKEVYNQLMEAQDALAEFEREHTYDQLNKELDNEASDVENRLDSKITEYENLLDDNVYLVEEAWRRMSDMNTDLYNQLAEHNAKHTTSIRDDLTDAWNTATDAVLKYKDAQSAYGSIIGQIGKPGYTDDEYSTDSGYIKNKQIFNWAEVVTAFGGEMLSVGTGLLSDFAGILDAVFDSPVTKMFSIGTGALGALTSSGAGILSSVLGLLGGFAGGTNYVPKTGIYLTDELGEELKLIKNPNGASYTMLTRGSKVITNEATERLMRIINNPDLLTSSPNISISPISNRLPATQTINNQPSYIENTFYIQSSSPKEVASEIEKLMPKIANYTIGTMVNGSKNAGVKRNTQHLY